MLCMGQQVEILTYLCNKSNRAIEIGIVYYSRKFEEGKKKILQYT